MPGVKAVVIQLNRLVSPSESDDLLCKRLEQLVARLPDDIYLGIYESRCPISGLPPTSCCVSA